MASMEQMKRESERVSGVSNIAYDLLTILQHKLKAVSAMEQYRLDAQDQGDQEVLDIIADLERRSTEDIARLKKIVAERLR